MFVKVWNGLWFLVLSSVGMRHEITLLVSVLALFIG